MAGPQIVDSSKRKHTHNNNNNNNSETAAAQPPVLGPLPVDFVPVRGCPQRGDIVMFMKVGQLKRTYFTFMVFISMSCLQL